MSRLFVTDRELRLISDLNKELIRDVAGQKIFLHSISSTKTLAHDVYGEAIRKVWDNPIALDCLVDASFHNETDIKEAGVDQRYSLEVFVQWRDVVENGITLEIGDLISYSSYFFEVVDVTFIKTIYGEAEHKTGVKLKCVKARESMFKAPINGPTDIQYTDQDAVQHTFHQQRGYAENAEGETGDVRELVRDGVLDPLLTGPKEVSPRGDTREDVGSFYGDE